MLRAEIVLTVKLPEGQTRLGLRYRKPYTLNSWNSRPKLFKGLETEVFLKSRGFPEIGGPLLESLEQQLHFLEGLLFLFS